MENVLGYHVFKTQNGGLWLADDEHSWTKDFLESASFTRAELANDIGNREHPEGGFYIMACLGTM